MYMDEIQYTYKSCKLLLMKSIHENKWCILEKSKHKTWNLILWVLCKPSKHKLFETKTVKPKIKTINLCVWTWATSKLNYLYTRSKNKTKLNKPESSCKTPSSSWLEPNTIQGELDSNRVLDAILTREFLNQHVIASKLDFMFLLKLNTNYDIDLCLKLIEHMTISTITS